MQSNPGNLRWSRKSYLGFWCSHLPDWPPPCSFNLAASLLIFLCLSFSLNVVEIHVLPTGRNEIYFTVGVLYRFHGEIFLEEYFAWLTGILYLSLNLWKHFILPSPGVFSGTFARDRIIPGLLEIQSKLSLPGRRLYQTVSLCPSKTHFRLIFLLAPDSRQRGVFTPASTRRRPAAPGRGSPHPAVPRRGRQGAPQTAGCRAARRRGAQGRARGRGEPQPSRRRQPRSSAGHRGCSCAQSSAQRRAPRARSRYPRISLRRRVE